MDSKRVATYQRVILENYAQNGRVLPWRQTTAVYPILVSEIMLQQTQVPRVIEKYLAFLEEFPTASHLAKAPLIAVYRLWQGLGYNRRAKYLQQCAVQLVDNPKPTQEELLSWPGIGPYTAAAVCAFAYNADVAAIDVNVRRVAQRYFGHISDDAIGLLVPSDRSRDWHNALMDYGSQICTKKQPSCETCALHKTCHAFNHKTFTQERSHTQSTFNGSVRWHRGQILKLLLRNDQSPKQIWDELPVKHRNKEKYHQAIENMKKENLISQNENRLHITHTESAHQT